MIDEFFLEEDATKFDDYDDAIIGYTEDGRLVYDVDRIIDDLEKDMTHDEAVEFYEYNVLRTVPYMGEHSPVMMYRAKWEDRDEQTGTDTTGEARPDHCDHEPRSAEEGS